MVGKVLSIPQEQFPSIKYILGVSALCTEERLKAELKYSKNIVTCICDNFKVTKELLNSESQLLSLKQNGEKSNLSVVLLKYSEIFSILVNILIIPRSTFIQ